MYSKPFFSVIIPAYNAGKFIRDTLDSVRRQTFNDYEIILVNDGSIDNTLEVAKAYFSELPNLRHKIVEQPNRGIGAARNAGIKAAEGELVAFLDADDLWHQEKLLRIKEYLNEIPNADLICNDENLAGNGRIIKRLTYGPYTSYRDLLFKGNCLSTSATVVRKEKLYVAGLFSENLAYNSAEDYELWLRLSRICKMVYLHEVLGTYNIYATSIANINVQKHMENSLSVLDYHFSLWEDKSFYYRYLINKRKAVLIRSTARALLRRGDIRSAGDIINQSLKTSPFSLKAWAVFAFFILSILIRKQR